jgi:hypothetical protein
MQKKWLPERGSPWYPPLGGYGMGEEKPEEELMGKLSLLRGDGILLCRHFYLFPCDRNIYTVPVIFHGKG